MTHALTTPEATGLGRIFAGEAERHPGRSGFALLASSREAFHARHAMAILAERTLDVQYYLWGDDASGRLLAGALLDAADRGVRVRMLLDDHPHPGRDSELALLAAHPNVEVRIFNPFAGRSQRVTDVLFDFHRITHRMHNKAYIADNAIAIIGGRNVTDEYFATNDEFNFRDLDLYVVGPIIHELSASFDDYWNSTWSVPAGRLAGAKPDPARLPQLSRYLAAPELPFDTALDREGAARLLAQVRARLIWAEAAMMVDRPDKPETAEPLVLEGLQAALRDRLDRDLLIEVAYFIPGDAGVEYLCGFARRGIRVRVFTNSLASNDMITAHPAYARYRPPLLRCGVELYEMRADPGFVEKHWGWLSSGSEANLHSKAVVIDGRDVIIGSLNLDPRSFNLNTELAIIVDSPELAAQTTAFIEAGMTSENAYRLELDEKGDIVWTGTAQGKLVRLTREPGATFGRSILVWLLSLLPIEDQL